MPQPSTWIVVANSAEAKIFRLVQFPKVEEIGYFEHPESRLRDQDLTSSAPGRSFDSGGVTRHAYQQVTDPKLTEIDKFARFLGGHINEEYRKQAFGRLYLIAGPHFLGLLRKYLDGNVQKAIVNEAPKDIVEFNKQEIESHIASYFS